MLGEVDLFAGHEAGIEMVKRYGSTGECLDEVALDGAQLIGAAEVRLNGRHEPVEDLGRARPAVELVPGEQLLCRRRLGAFPGLSGGQAVGKLGVFRCSFMVFSQPRL